MTSEDLKSAWRKEKKKEPLTEAERAARQADQARWAGEHSRLAISRAVLERLQDYFGAKKVAAEAERILLTAASGGYVLRTEYEERIATLLGQLAEIERRRKEHRADAEEEAERARRAEALAAERLDARYAHYRDLIQWLDNNFPDTEPDSDFLAQTGTPKASGANPTEAPE